MLPPKWVADIRTLAPPFGAVGENIQRPVDSTRRSDMNDML